MDKLISRAQSMGSTATTHAGARRYLLQQIAAHRDTRPLHMRGYRGGRSAGAADAYRSDRRVRRAMALCAGLGMWPLDEAEALAAAKDAEYLAQYEAAIRAGHSYRVSESAWAGGNHSIDVQFADPMLGCSASGYSERAWSDNQKWSGTNSVHRYRIARRVPLHMAVIGGLVTLDAEIVGPREYRATWAEQARGFNLRFVRGYIIRGYHVATNSLDRARRVAAAARAQTLSTRMVERGQRSTTRAANRALATVWVSVQDSLRAGNCEAATNSVAAQIRRDLGGDVYAVRSDYLLTVRDDHYTRRAVAAARQKGGA